MLPFESFSPSFLFIWSFVLVCLHSCNFFFVLYAYSHIQRRLKLFFCFFYCSLWRQAKTFIGCYHTAFCFFGLYKTFWILNYCCSCSYNLCVLLNKSGLCVLRYLQEIGYTDTIIDVRSARVRSLLGLQPVASDNDNESQPALVNGEQQPGKRDSQGKRYMMIVMVRMVIVSAFGEASTPSLIEECVLWEFSLF